MVDLKDSVTRFVRALRLNALLERFPAGRTALRAYRRWLGPGRYAGELPDTVRIAGTDIEIRPDDVFTAHFCYRAREHIEEGELLYEPATTRVVRSCLPDAGCAIDAGAHVGYFALMMAGLAPQLDVYAFEPLEGFASAIEKHARLNGIENLEVVRRPLGRNDAVVEFANYLEHARARAIGLDAFCERQGCTPGFVKVDVEGQELDLLESGEGTLRTATPTLAVEVHPSKIAGRGRDPGEVIDLLAGFGYSFRVERRGDRPGEGSRTLSAGEALSQVERLRNTYLLVAEAPC